MSAGMIACKANITSTWTENIRPAKTHNTHGGGGTYIIATLIFTYRAEDGSRNMYVCVYYTHILCTRRYGESPLGGVI
jgi:hypothetical protein